MQAHNRKNTEQKSKYVYILETAEKLMFKDKHRAALGLLNPFTMDDLAEKCGIAKGTLYLYFKNKSEIYLAFGAKILNLYYENYVIPVVESSKNAKEKLTHLAYEYIRFSEEHRVYYMSLKSYMFEAMSAMKQKTPESCKFMDINGNIETAMNTILLDGIKEGTIKSQFKPPAGSILVFAATQAFMDKISLFPENELKKLGFTKLQILDMYLESILSSILTTPSQGKN